MKTYQKPNTELMVLSAYTSILANSAPGGGDPYSLYEEVGKYGTQF